MIPQPQPLPQQQPQQQVGPALCPDWKPVPLRIPRPVAATPQRAAIVGGFIPNGNHYHHTTNGSPHHNDMNSIYPAPPIPPPPSSLVGASPLPASSYHAVGNGRVEPRDVESSVGMLSPSSAGFHSSPPSGMPRSASFNTMMQTPSPSPHFYHYNGHTPGVAVSSTNGNGYYHGQGKSFDATIPSPRLGTPMSPSLATSILSQINRHVPTPSNSNILSPPSTTSNGRPSAATPNSARRDHPVIIANGNGNGNNNYDNEPTTPEWLSLSSNTFAQLSAMKCAPLPPSPIPEDSDLDVQSNGATSSLSGSIPYHQSVGGPAAILPPPAAALIPAPTTKSQIVMPNATRTNTNDVAPPSSIITESLPSQSLSMMRAPSSTPSSYLPPPMANGVPVTISSLARASAVLAPSFYPASPPLRRRQSASWSHPKYPDLTRTPIRYFISNLSRNKSMINEVM
jgi:hypothetical protein